MTPSCAQSGAASGDNLSQLSLDYEELMQQPHEPSVLDLVAGALESAFWVMDSVILNDKLEYKITGGWRHLLCPALTPLLQGAAPAWWRSSSVTGSSWPTRATPELSSSGSWKSRDSQTK